MIHSRRRTASWLFITGWLAVGAFHPVLEVSATTLLAGTAQGESGQEEETPENWETKQLAGARQNQLLREYFQEQYRFFNNSPGLEPNQRFREEYIDRRIDHFLTEIQDKLEIIHQLYGQASRHRSEALDPENSEQTKAVAVREFEKTLDELKGKVDSLRDQLALIFRGLDHKRDLEQAPKSEDTTAPFYGSEMAFIADQLEKADARIREYFFLSLNTVRWDHLQDQNMLVNLYWAQKMAEHTVRQIRASR